MNKSDITTPLNARLESGALNFPGAWPNIGYGGATPYFEVTFVGVNRTGRLKGGGFRRETGTMAVTVAVEVGTGTVQADTYADAIAALFPGGLRIAATGGIVSVRDETIIEGGYRADAEWRVPVLIRYSALAA